MRSSPSGLRLLHGGSDLSLPGKLQSVALKFALFGHEMLRSAATDPQATLCMLQRCHDLSMTHIGMLVPQPPAHVPAICVLCCKLNSGQPCFPNFHVQAITQLIQGCSLVLRFQVQAPHPTAAAESCRGALGIVCSLWLCSAATHWSEAVSRDPLHSSL